MNEGRSWGDGTVALGRGQKAAADLPAAPRDRVPAPWRARLGVCAAGLLALALLLGFARTGSGRELAPTLLSVGDETRSVPARKGTGRPRPSRPALAPAERPRRLQRRRAMRPEPAQASPEQIPAAPDPEIVDAPPAPPPPPAVSSIPTPTAPAVEFGM